MTTKTEKLILTEEFKQKILDGWKRIKKNWEFTDSENPKTPVKYIFPIREDITGIVPRTNPGTLNETDEKDPEKKRRFGERKREYRKYCDNLKQKLAEIKSGEGYEKIEELSCYLDVVFRKFNPADEDNLIKAFKDVLAEIFLKDDGQIINSISEAEINENIPKGGEGMSFVLIPTYELAIKSVKRIKGADLRELYELRKSYAEWQIAEGILDPKKNVYSHPLGGWQKGAKMFPPWQYPMEMIETNYGFFFDNLKNESRGGTTFYGSESRLFQGKAEPGYNWKASQNKRINGVMVYERSACWWVNKRKI